MSTKNVIASIDDILLKPLQQQERLFKYFILSPVEIRRGLLYQQGKFAPPASAKPGVQEQPVADPGYIEGGIIRWQLKAAN